MTTRIIEICHVNPSPPPPAADFTLSLTFFDTFWLKLSPVERIFFYRFPSAATSQTDVIIPRLKRSLSLALRHFLPLAGKLTWPEEAEIPFILCSPNDGVSFTVAESTVNNFDLVSGDEPVDASLSRACVPELVVSGSNAAVLALQVTVFRQGFCVGVTSHHAVLDGKSTVMFMKAWAHISKELGNGAELTEELTPFLDRTVVKDPDGIALEDVKTWMAMNNIQKNPRSLELMSENIPAAEGTRSNQVIKKLDHVLDEAKGKLGRIFGMVADKREGLIGVGVAGSPRLGVYDVDFGFGRPNKVEITSIDRTPGMSMTDSRDGSGGIEVETKRRNFSHRNGNDYSNYRDLPRGTVAVTGVRFHPAAHFLRLLLAQNCPRRANLLLPIPSAATSPTDVIIPRLKRSLSLALRHFLPLAGKLTWPEEAEIPFLLYKQNDSVSLTVAESTIDNFDLVSGDGPREASLSRAYVSKLDVSGSNATVLALQVTVFRQGFCVGVTCHHAVLDGKSSVMFMKAWAHVSKELGNGAEGGELTEDLTPFLDRTVVKDPDGIALEDVKTWMTINKIQKNPRSLELLSGSVFPGTRINQVRGTFKLSRKAINKLKICVLHEFETDSNDISHQPTRSNILSAFVVTFAHTLTCMAKAKELDDDKDVTFGFTADCRSRLKPSLPLNYFGNSVIAIPVSFMKIGDLVHKGGKARVAQAIIEEIKKLDHNVLDGVKGKLGRLVSLAAQKKEGLTGVGVAGSTRLRVYDVDFGFGKLEKVEITSIDRSSAISMAESGDGNGVHILFFSTDFTLPLTFFDTFWLKFPPVEQIYFYRFPSTATSLPDVIIHRLKRSLSLALRHFLPLAGKLTWPEHAEIPLLLYTPKDGVSLTIAESTDDNFDLLSGDGPHDASVSHAYVPKLVVSGSNAAVLALQVTVFRQGFCVRVTSHHAVIDGKSAVMFMKAWAYVSKELGNGAEGGELTEGMTPFVDRTVVKDPDGIALDDVKIWMAMNSKQNNRTRSLELISETVPACTRSNQVRGTFKLSQKDINKLKKNVQHQLGMNDDHLATKLNNYLSTFVVTFAHTLVCMAKAKELDDSKDVIFGFSADCRSRLKLPSNYFGNCIMTFTAAAMKIGDVVHEGGIACVAHAIIEVISIETYCV
ncbi:Malonyl-CoA:anthocyanidin 5-O-glucoside-6''-O-malonyltransferase [Linum perenne]